MPISFQYQVPEFSLRKKKKIIDWILLVSYLEETEVNDINYIFCDDKYLLSLNKEFLHHKTYTDILTFDYSLKKEIIAEIYISIDRVRENASNFNTSFQNELLRVMIHGVLHCIGYSDKTQGTEARMRKKENEYLSLYLEMK